MTDLQTIEAIHRHLDECPTDWTARLQLADLYEEAGDELRARYQRWAVKWERAPMFWDCGLSAIHHWHWWARHEKGITKRESLTGGIAKRALQYHRGSKTRREAEDDLMMTLASEGWPDV